MTIDMYEDVYVLWQKMTGLCLSESDSKKGIAKFLKRNKDMSFAAYEGETLIGAVLSGHDGLKGFIHHLAVARKYRRNGIGRELVERCLEALSLVGISHYQIVVASDNISGQNFWEELGWEIVDDYVLMSNDSNYAINGKKLWEFRIENAHVN